MTNPEIEQAITILSYYKGQLNIDKELDTAIKALEEVKGLRLLVERQRMTVKEAKAYLKNYPCVCKYGVSPYDCKDREGCKFSKAIRTICEEAENGSSCDTV